MYFSRKEQIESKIKSQGYKKTCDFLIDLIKRAYPEKNAYEYYKSNRGNLTKALLGERGFKENEIVAIEDLLGQSFRDILNYKNDFFVPKGIRYMAFSDNLNLIDEEIISKWDEFDKNILDYVLEYNSKNIFRYLIEKNHLQLNYQMNGFTLFGGFVNASTRRIIEMLYEMNDIKLFNTLFPINILIENFYHNNYGIFSSDFFSSLIEQRTLINMMLKQEYEIKINDIITSAPADIKGVFIHPLLTILISEHLVLFKNDDEYLREVITKAIKLNEKIFKKTKDYYTEYNLTNQGFIKDGQHLIGSCISLCIKEVIDFSKETNQQIEVLESQINNFKFNSRHLNGGFSNSKVRIDNGRIVKKATNNNIEYDFLRLMENNNCDYVPKYLGQQNGLDYFSYIDGTTKLSVYECSDDEIKQAVNILKTINNISKKALGGKVYVHGDLSQMNIIFKDGKMMGIIDWDSCHIGEEYYDFIYLFWTLTNIGSYTRNNEKIFERLGMMVDLYNPTKDFKSNFKDKIIEVMQSRIKNITPNNPQYERLYQWVKWSEIWVDLYCEKIREMIG